MRTISEFFHHAPKPITRLQRLLQPQTSPGRRGADSSLHQNLWWRNVGLVLADDHCSGRHRGCSGECRENFEPTPPKGRRSKQSQLRLAKLSFHPPYQKRFLSADSASQPSPFRLHRSSFSVQPLSRNASDRRVLLAQRLDLIHSLGTPVMASSSSSYSTDMNPW